MTQLRPHTLQLLSQSQHFAPQYQHGLTNHLSMTLVALEYCQASEQQLSEFYQHYTARLESLDDNSIRHTQRRYLEAQAQYLAELEEQGTDAALKRHISELIRGISAAGFHGIIRLAYAVLSQQHEQIAAALAYWQCEYQSLGPLESISNYRAEQHIAKIQEAFSAQPEIEGLIADAMLETYQSEPYAPFRALPDTLTYEQVAQITLEHYARSDDFNLLHGVTGLHALTLLLPYISDHQQALNYFWQAYCSVFVSSDLTQQQNCKPTTKTWPELLQQASQSHNDHTIKLALSCRDLDTIFANPLYKHALATRLAKESS